LKPGPFRRRIRRRRWWEHDHPTIAVWMLGRFITLIMIPNGNRRPFDRFHCGTRGTHDGARSDDPVDLNVGWVRVDPPGGHEKPAWNSLAAVHWITDLDLGLPRGGVRQGVVRVQFGLEYRLASVSLRHGGVLQGVIRRGSGAHRGVTVTARKEAEPFRM